MAETDATSRLFGELWDTAKTVGVGMLQNEGAARLAEFQTRNQIQQQQLYTKLAEQSPNLGPNEVRPAQGAAVLQTSVMQGPRAVADAINKFPLGWLMVAMVVGVILYLVLPRRK